MISIEDKDFERHWGVNVWRMMGAAYRDIESGGKVQGASTLTMQLARDLFLSPDRSFHRKIQEVLLAIQIERTKRVPTPRLNDVVRKAVDAHPLTDRGRALKIYYTAQTGTAPPPRTLAPARR